MNITLYYEIGAIVNPTMKPDLNLRIDYIELHYNNIAGITYPIYICTGYLINDDKFPITVKLRDFEIVR